LQSDKNRKQWVGKEEMNIIGDDNNGQYGVTPSYGDNPQYYTQYQQYDNQANQGQQNINSYNQNINNYQQNINNYQQSINSYNQNNSQYQQNQQTLTKQKKQKRKRKHRFLKFMLLVIVLIFAYKVLRHLGNSAVQKELNSFAVDYPFTFENENDCTYYVTGNINVPTYYELNDKSYNVEWSSRNKYLSISNGDITVTRPSDTSSTATLTCTYKKWYGKATQDFTLTIIPTSSLDVSDINVVTIDSVKNQEYTRDMEVELNDDGYAKYMYGDFGKIYVYSEDDAKAVIRAYSEQIGLEDEIDITLGNLVNSTELTTYTFNTSYNGINYSGETIQLVVNKDSKLVQLSSYIKQHDIIDIEEKEIDIEAVLDSYLEEDYVYSVEEKSIKDNEIIQKVYVYTETGHVYTIYINSNSEVISCKESMRTLDFGSTNLNTVEGNGEDELGVTHTFPAKVISDNIITGQRYRMTDVMRNIYVYDLKDAKESLWANMTGNKGRLGLSSIFELIIGGKIESSVDSDSTTFDNAVAVEAYTYIIDAYDWYKDTFGLISYDNKGGDINIITNYFNMTDNAAWSDELKIFVACPSRLLKYTVAVTPEVFAHEYTHAVFGNTIGDLAFSTDSNIELDALNEAYGDIFGCISSNSSTWEIGDNYTADDNTEAIFRDIANFNSDKVWKYAGKFPETYHGDNWEEEEHNESIIISHVAYKMFKSDLFTSKDIANIWYQSLILGYGADTTFVDCRKNVIKAAELLGYSDSQIDFIANEFDLVEVFDNTYVFKTKSSIQPVEGDSVLDNTDQRTFLTVYSPIGIWLNKETSIVIYEEKVNVDVDEEKMSETLTKYFNNAGLSNVKVTYKQIPKYKIWLAKKFCNETDDKLMGILDDKLSMASDDEEMREVWYALTKLAFTYQITESTPYSFYRELIEEIEQ
jgi:Zn-dependent metalloprotease